MQNVYKTEMSFTIDTVYTQKRSLTVASFKFYLSQTLRQLNRRTCKSPNPSSDSQHYSMTARTTFGLKPAGGCRLQFELDQLANLHSDTLRDLAPLP